MPESLEGEAVEELRPWIVTPCSPGEEGELGRGFQPVEPGRGLKAWDEERLTGREVRVESVVRPLGRRGVGLRLRGAAPRRRRVLRLPLP